MDSKAKQKLKGLFAKQRLATKAIVLQIYPTY
jgi:hypothetical protein